MSTSTSPNLEEIYQIKYLKYKQKYIELKYNQSGGIFDSGYALVFTSSTNAEKLNEAFTNKKINNKNDIAIILNKNAYIIFDSSKTAQLLESNSSIIKDKLSAAASTTKSSLNSAYNTSVSVASKASKALNQMKKIKGGDIVIIKTIQMQNNKPFDRTNAEHKKYIAEQASDNLSIDKSTSISIFTIKFSMFGKPELISNDLINLEKVEKVENVEN